MLRFPGEPLLAPFLIRSSSSCFLGHYSSSWFLFLSFSYCWCWSSPTYWSPVPCDCLSSFSLFLLISCFFLTIDAFLSSKVSSYLFPFYCSNGSYWSFILCFFSFPPVFCCSFFLLSMTALACRLIFSWEFSACSSAFSWCSIGPNSLVALYQFMT